MNYRDEIFFAMTHLGKDARTVFIGQSVCYPGHVMFSTLKGVPMKKRVEIPVFEDTQMGMSIGLSLIGMIPITIYPRMDFLIIAANQLVNHLAIISEMSQGQFEPKVIIRTMLGSMKPLYPGLQHCKDLTEPLRLMIDRRVAIVKLDNPDTVVEEYLRAMERPISTLMIEIGDLYD